MGMIKKCSACSNKGLFLKLKNGLCLDCIQNLNILEKSYTEILTEIAINPSNKDLHISKLQTFIEEIKPFKNLTNTINVTECELLLNSLTNTSSIFSATSKKNIPIEEVTVEKNTQTNIVKTKIEPLVESSIKKNTTQNLHIEQSKMLVPNNIVVKNVLKPISTKQINSKNEPNTSIKLSFSNLNAKGVNLSDAIKEKTSNMPKQQINLTIGSLTQKEVSNNNKININLNNTIVEEINKEIPVSSKNIKFDLNNLSANNITLNNEEISNSKDSISLEDVVQADSPIITSLKKSALIELKKFEDISLSTDMLAKAYFNFKNNFELELTKNSITDIDSINIADALDLTKRTLCLRTKKTESELYDLFNYVSVSIQTTGLTPDRSDIIEIAAHKISYGEIIDEFYSLVNPIKSIKLSVTRNTGISNEDVVSAPTLDIILPKFLDFLGSHSILAHNSKFVDLFLRFNFKKLTGKDLTNTNTCTMKLYRIRFKNYHGYATNAFDINTCCNDLLSTTDLSYILDIQSPAKSNSYKAYKLFETLKYRYK